MIATGLVFVLGALVATLLALLFVPLLWRNAQRLARRDFAATMPATMNEIRAEVDRVRAEAAMTVRRHEMLTQKARERAALERAAVGRLTTEHAEMSLLGDQHSSEANFLRGQLTQAQERIGTLEEDRIRLEEENSALKGTIDHASKAALAAAATSDTIEAGGPGDAAPSPANDDPSPLFDPDPAPVAQDGETARMRVATATAALAALAREPQPEGGEAATSEPLAVGPSLGREAADIRAIALAPSSQDPEALRNENGVIRERIADFAARVIQMTAAREGPASPLAALQGRSEAPGADGTAPSLAERVRRLTAPKEEPVAAGLDGDTGPPPVAGTATADAAEATAAPSAVSPPEPAKRRRSRGRPRQPSRR